MTCELFPKFIVFQNCLYDIYALQIFFYFDVVKFTSLFIMDSGLFSTVHIKGFLTQKY